MEDEAWSGPSSRSASRTVSEHATDKSLEVIKIILSKRNFKRIAVQTVDPTVPQVVKENLEVIKIVPQERVVEQNVDAAVAR